MTDQQETTTGDPQSPKADLEATAKKSLLYRLRYEAHQRIPNLISHPDTVRRLAVMREQDPTANAKSTPPTDEFIDLRCMWAVEFYSPAYVDLLLAGLRKLGWDKKESINHWEDPSAWIQRTRHCSFSMGWLNLGLIRSSGADSYDPFLSSRIGPLPPYVQRATGRLYSLTSSLTCIVMEFTFKENYSSKFDEALRTNLQTYIKPSEHGFQIYDPKVQKTELVRQIRANMTKFLTMWFRENLPGLFSSGVHGGDLPTCEFVVLRQAEPFSSPRERGAHVSTYLSVLGMAQDFDVWRSVQVQGLRFKLSQMDNGTLQYHSIFAIKESDLDEYDLKLRSVTNRFTQTLCIADSANDLLCRCAILPLLDGYNQHLIAIRSSATFRSKSRENAVKILETLGQHVSHSVDITAVTDELISFTQDYSLFGLNVKEFKPCNDQLYDDGDTLAKKLCYTIGKRATWLRNSDQSLRDHMAQYGSLLGVKENIRLQKVIRFLTYIIVILSIASLWGGRSKLLQWLRDLWHMLTMY